VCQEFEIEIESKIIPQIASCFAGGIGNTGAVCGAVAGAVMGIGFKQGRADMLEEALRKLSVAREFRHRFDAEMETISFGELTGVDLSMDEGLEQFMSYDTPQTVCFPAVSLAYRHVVDLLK